MRKYTSLIAVCIVFAGCEDAKERKLYTGIAYQSDYVPMSDNSPNTPNLPNVPNSQRKAKVGSGDHSPDGKELLMLEYPSERHQKNSVGTDGKGLCVFCSIHHSGDWQNEKLFESMFAFMKKQPGGGYPGKVDEMLKRAAKDLGVPMPKYIQIEDTDLAAIKLAVKNNMMPAVTYGISPTGRYQGKPISHMVNVAHATDNWYAVLDNNYTGIANLEWMGEPEFKRSHSYGTGKGWTIILLNEPPPPLPKSKVQ